MILDSFEAGYRARKTEQTKVSVTVVESLMLALAEHAVGPLHQRQLMDACQLAGRLLGMNIRHTDTARAFVRLSLHRKLRIHPDHTVEVVK
jgi:hypothetical protein